MGPEFYQACTQHPQERQYLPRHRQWESQVRAHMHKKRSTNLNSFSFLDVKTL